MECPTLKNPELGGPAAPVPAASLCPVLSSQSPPSSSPRMLQHWGAALSVQRHHWGLAKEVRAENVSGGRGRCLCARRGVCASACASQPQYHTVPASTLCHIYFLSTGCVSGMHPFSVHLCSLLSHFLVHIHVFPNPLSCFCCQPTPIHLQNPLWAAPPSGRPRGCQYTRGQSGAG